VTCCSKDAPRRSHPTRGLASAIFEWIEVDERRSPRTRGTVDQLLTRSLNVLDIDPSTEPVLVGQRLGL
jgi:hypothetical protein